MAVAILVVTPRTTLLMLSICLLVSLGLSDGQGTKTTKAQPCEPPSKRACKDDGDKLKPCPCAMWCIKTQSSDKKITRRCAALSKSCKSPNAAPQKYSKGVLVCKAGGKPRPIAPPKENDSPEPKIEMKDGKMDITLADGYSSEKGTKNIVSKPEFTPSAGGSMFSQVDSQMVGYDPNEE